MINRFKVGKIVEFAKLGEFPCDTEEITENLSDALKTIGIKKPNLTDDEHYLLMDELYPMAEQHELKEVARLAFSKHRDESVLFDSVQS